MITYVPYLAKEPVDKINAFLKGHKPELKKGCTVSYVFAIMFSNDTTRSRSESLLIFQWDSRLVITKPPSLEHARLTPSAVTNALSPWSALNDNLRSWGAVAAMESIQEERWM